jgi:PTH2 family peptidyl-tRNA hydrolase
MKQAIILRLDLKISLGKAIVQGCHASLGAYLSAEERKRAQWYEEGSKKIVLGVKNLEELLKIEKRCKEISLPCFLVRDAGLTEIEPGEITALGIGPEEDKKVDKIIGSLKLLK